MKSLTQADEVTCYAKVHIAYIYHPLLNQLVCVVATLLNYLTCCSDFHYSSVFFCRSLSEIPCKANNSKKGSLIHSVTAVIFLTGSKVTSPFHSNKPIRAESEFCPISANMSGLDVEALLDSTANTVTTDTKDSHTKDRDDRYRSDRRDKDRHRNDSRDRDRDRKRRDRSKDRSRKDKDGDGDEAVKSPRGGSAHGSHRSRRRSRSRDSDRRRSRRHRDSLDLDDSHRTSGGDYYRGGGRARTRSRSPNDDRYYRPGGRSRRDDEDRMRDRSPRRERNGGRKRSPSPKRPKSKSPTPQPTEDERDRRTVFVQQLAARLRTKELIAFFEKVGPVKEAQIVKDRVSGRSKG